MNERSNIYIAAKLVTGHFENKKTLHVNNNQSSLRMNENIDNFNILLA